MKLHSDYIDRLAQRVKFDRYGFLGFALLGAVLIVLAKVAGISATVSAVGAVLVMIAYAYLVTQTDMGRVRADQAGDNCYYLGLVYTLASLAYTIFTFDPDNTATGIVQGFGVALATTVFGLVLRVSFSQTRVDIVEIEDKARMELTDAANQLKASLSQVSLSMNEFSRETRQSIEEARGEMLQSVRDAFDEGAVAVTALAKTAAESLEANFTELGARSKRLGASTSRVVNALDGQGERLELLSLAATKATESLSAISTQAETASAGILAVAQHARALTAVQATSRSELTSMATVLDVQSKAVDGLHAAIEAMQASVLDGLAALENAPSRSLKIATDTLSAAAKEMQGEVARLSETSRAALQGIGKELASTTEAVRGHNAALEADLAVSRANVGKVHTALVEMTGALVGQVESRATQ